MSLTARWCLSVDFFAESNFVIFEFSSSVEFSFLAFRKCLLVVRAAFFLCLPPSPLLWSSWRVPQTWIKASSERPFLHSTCTAGRAGDGSCATEDFQKRPALSLVPIHACSFDHSRSESIPPTMQGLSRHKFPFASIQSPYLLWRTIKLCASSIFASDSGAPEITVVESFVSSSYFSLPFIPRHNYRVALVYDVWHWLYFIQNHPCIIFLHCLVKRKQLHSTVDPVRFV